MGALEIGEAGPSTSGGSGVIVKMVLVASIAAGVQFGWALQLSLLTPYTQLLGVTHQWAAIVWLCGPISGLVVQPIAGYYSDKCNSRFGRRRPFIAVGSCLVILAVFLIGFAADWGHAAGDDLHKTPKPRAVLIFVIGFWILDCANNMMQGPCRALLADLSEGDSKKISTANALFSFFMAVGNVLGYAAGSYTKLYTFFPFSFTEACQVYCANLKSCFFISVALLMTVTILALTIVQETPFTAEQEREANEKKMDLINSLKGLPKPMWILMLVTCLNWIAWFPFLLFDTDWMGREVYGGDVGETIYDSGVRAGSLGLMLNSVVLAFASLGVQRLATGAGRVKNIWGGVNVLLSICLFSTVWITRAAKEDRYAKGAGAAMIPLPSVKNGALTVFAILGIPLSVTFSLPFALASIYSSEGGSGQGLSLGLMNLAIVVPQIIVSVSSGPLDQAFGGGNLPAFVMGGIAAAASAVCAVLLLPSTEDGEDKPVVVGMGGGH